MLINKLHMLFRKPASIKKQIYEYFIRKNYFCKRRIKILISFNIKVRSAHSNELYSQTVYNYIDNSETTEPLQSVHIIHNSKVPSYNDLVQVPKTEATKSKKFEISMSHDTDILPTYSQLIEVFD